MRSTSGSFATGAPTLAWFVALWLAVEIGAAVLLPLVVPRSAWVAWYQTEQAEASVERFLAGEHLLAPDPSAGWRNAPSRTLGPWATDSLGARVAVVDAPDARDGSAGPELLLLGSSMVNGGTVITWDETISAALERDGFPTRNFGTMLYGLDQALLSWRSRLSTLGSDVVVVGIDPDPLAPLESVWVPLRRRSEVNMPFVKPRFVLHEDTLALVDVDPEALLPPSGRTELVETFRRHDGFAHRFEHFVRFEQTPVLAAAARVVAGVLRRVRPPPRRPESAEILERLLAELRRDVEGAGSRLLVVAMPPGPGVTDAEVVGPIRDRVRRWRAAGLDVVDASTVFEESGVPGTELYGPDGVHLSGRGNEILAEAIARSVRSDG